MDSILVKISQYARANGFNVFEFEESEFSSEYIQISGMDLDIIISKSRLSGEYIINNASLTFTKDIIKLMNFINEIISTKVGLK